MIYDCFTFFNELDVLELRLNILNPVVDKFVIVEATKTHSGNDKELVFMTHRDRFKAFEDKIIYIVPRSYPEFKTSWTYENYQRNCIAQGLTDCKPSDTILISDCDEIPNPDVVKKNEHVRGLKILEQYMFFYFLNFLDVGAPLWEGGTRMMPYSFFCTGLNGIKAKYNDYLIKGMNIGTTATKLRLWKYAEHIPHGGWHFSFLGGVESIVKKIQSYSHQELNKEKFLDITTIERKIAAGEDVFDRPGHVYKAVQIDNSYPNYIRDNMQKLSLFLAPNATMSLSDVSTKKTLFSDLFARFDIWRHMRRRDFAENTIL